MVIYKAVRYTDKVLEIFRYRIEDNIDSNTLMKLHKISFKEE